MVCMFIYTVYDPELALSIILLKLVKKEEGDNLHKTLVCGYLLLLLQTE